MIWIVHGGSWRCSNCLTMPMCKAITDMKYCPNCGAKAIMYETEMYNPGKLNTIVTHPMDPWTPAKFHWDNDDFPSDDFEKPVKVAYERTIKGATYDI